jgi:hypothetical protein
MTGACERADADGVATYLETTNPDNLDYYQRYGFDVRDTIDLGGGVPTCWTMLRPATRPM